MTRKTKTTIKVSALLTIVFALLIIIIFSSNSSRDLSVIFFANANAALIQTPEKQTIVIGDASDKNILSALGGNLPFYKRTIDLFIDPRESGIREKYGNILEQQYHIKKILTPEDLRGDSQTITLGNDLLFTLSFAGTSLVAKLTFKNQTFLFAPELSEKDEAYLMASHADVKADVLQVGRSGSSSSLSEEWVTAVSPKIAIIQVTFPNRNGNPAPHILRRLELDNVQVYRTDINGDIIFKTHGENLYVSFR